MSKAKIHPFVRQASVVISKHNETLTVAREFSHRTEMMEILLNCREKLEAYRDRLKLMSQR